MDTSSRRAKSFARRTAFAMLFRRKWVWILLTAFISILCWLVLFPTVLWLFPVRNNYYPVMLKFMHYGIPCMTAVQLALSMTEQHHTATTVTKALKAIDLQQYPPKKRYAYLSALLKSNYQAITSSRDAHSGNLTIPPKLAGTLVKQFPEIVKDVDFKSERRQRRSRG